MTSAGRTPPEDLRVALALFSRAAAAFDALDESRRAALVDWIDEATSSRERADRIAEVAVRANSDDLADLVADRRTRQRATTANGGGPGTLFKPPTPRICWEVDT